MRSSMRKRGWVEQSYRRPLGDQDGIITKLPIKKTAKPKADSGLYMYMSMYVHIMNHDDGSL